VIIIVGAVLAVWRRFVLKPDRLDSKPDDHLKYLWVFLILLTGYLIKGFRLMLAGGSLPRVFSAGRRSAPPCPGSSSFCRPSS